MASPTCPTNNNYKQEYLAIKYDYDTNCSMTDAVLDNYINTLDTKVKNYETSLPDTRPSFCFNSDGDIQGHSDVVDGSQMYTVDECKALLQRTSPGSTWNPASFQGYDVTTARFQANYYGYCQSADGAASYSYTCRTPANLTTTSPTQQAQRDLSGSFQPISQYYSNLVSIKKRLNDFLECSAQQIQDAKPYSVNKERYFERANPKDAVMPRELVFGLFSQLRPSSVPIVMAAGVFMSCLALLIIFQMFGFTGEIHMPPALTKMQVGLGAAGASSTPLHQNPMVLSGVSIVLGVAVIILGVMYYRSKK
jgi:hypothetical protein